MSRSPDWEQATGRADALEWLARQPLALSPARGPWPPCAAWPGAPDDWEERVSAGVQTGSENAAGMGKIGMRGILPDLEGRTWSGCASAGWAGPAGHSPTLCRKPGR